jgi:hypothetical protein
MVKCKILTSVLALSLCAAPIVVLAAFDDKKIEARVAKIEEDLKKDKYAKEIERLQNLKDASTTGDKKQYFEDRIMAQTVMQEIERLDKEDTNTGQDTNKATIAKYKKQLETLNEGIVQWETTNASKTEKIIGASVFSVAAFITFLSVKGIIGAPLATLYYKLGIDKIMPSASVWSYGWKSAVALSCTAVLASVAFGGMRSINKIGRTIGNNCMVKKICGWWKNKSEAKV